GCHRTDHQPASSAWSRDGAQVATNAGTDTDRRLRVRGCRQACGRLWDRHARRGVERREVHGLRPGRIRPNGPSPKRQLDLRLKLTKHWAPSPLEPRSAVSRSVDRRSRARVVSEAGPLVMVSSQTVTEGGVNRRYTAAVSPSPSNASPSRM